MKDEDYKDSHVRIAYQADLSRQITSHKRSFCWNPCTNSGWDGGIFGRKGPEVIMCDARDYYSIG